jgi:hypothetical protein
MLLNCNKKDKKRKKENHGMNEKDGKIFLLYKIPGWWGGGGIYNLYSGLCQLSLID